MFGFGEVMSVRFKGIQLVQMLVALCMIAVLAVVSLPMLSSASSKAGASACNSNLMTLGNALMLYDTDHGQLPHLFNLDRPNSSVVSLDSVFAPGRIEIASLNCPSDTENLFVTTGTSYAWNEAWNDIPLSLANGRAVLPILADKAPFHAPRAAGYNALYIDSPAPGRPELRVETIDTVPSR